MKVVASLIVSSSLVMASCVSKENHGIQTDGISGTYVREYSFKVVNAETGNEIGLASIRDTILIQQNNKGYQVANNKWRLNDYDKQGWQNMEHADDKPAPVYEATFQSWDSALVERSMPTLFFNGHYSAVYIGKKGKEHTYRKVQ